MRWLRFGVAAALVGCGGDVNSAGDSAATGGAGGAGGADAALDAPPGCSNIKLEDPNVEEEVFRMLGQASGPITAEQARQVIVLRVDGVRTLAGLECFTALRDVTLGSGSIVDLSPLVGATELEQLDLWTHRIEDLTPLASLQKLTNLSVTSAPLVDLAPLAGLTELVHLSVSYTQVSDLSPLQSLPRLKSLNVDGTQVTSIEPLRGLGSLRHVSLNSTDVTDLSPLGVAREPAECASTVSAGATSRLIGPSAVEACENGWAVFGSYVDSTENFGCHQRCWRV